ncbi:ubiquinol oxidase subunit II [Buchnera aphidicola (Astegopteryx bambusae)]|uniref:ubiquinol oxidase subunit II n=1 Tax=Buchnera aphidicola TaxID=9 RepID=UPI0031B8795A
MIKNFNLLIFIFIVFFMFVLSEIKTKMFFNSYGYIREQENHLIIILFLTMLLVIIPVIIMTIFFSIKYNENNKEKRYTPNWDNSYFIESTIWIVPMIIILFFSFLSIHSTKKLDPRRNINNFHKTLEIDVISLDWCWLFIYPNYHVASINEVVFPANTLIKFNLTSGSVMNSFFIPNLGSQIYTMPGAKTNLYLISKYSGVYKGFSANYSGEGFSNMKFSVLIFKNRNNFLNWIKKLKQSKNFLNNYRKFSYLKIPKKNRQVEYFSNVYPKLFYNVIEEFNCKNSN